MPQYLPGADRLRSRPTRRRVLSALGVGGLLGLTGMSSATGGDRSPTAAGDIADSRDPGLEPSEVEWLSDRLVEFTFEDTVVDPPLAQANVRVLLPEGYEGARQTYPAIYLFHGGGGTAADWSTEDAGPGPIQNYLDEDVVVVMPDGDRGWYTDWYNDGAFGRPKWETFHVHQLIPFVERNFRVRSERGSRVVAGLSQGSTGALLYGARHPDTFAGVYSFSGGPFPIEQMQSQAENDELVQFEWLRAWGDPRAQETRWRGHNPNHLLENYRNLRLYMAVGQGEPGGPAPEGEAGLGIEQIAHQNYERFVSRLDEAGVEYDYDVFEERGHNWHWWHRDMQRVLPDVMDLFESDPVSPAGFTHLTIETDTEVWGWRLHRHDLDRTTAEFLTVEDVNPDGLTVRGRGMVTLETPPLYRPGADYEVSASGDGVSIDSNTVRADTSGRLSVGLRLGRTVEYPAYGSEGPRVAEVSISY